MNFKEIEYIRSFIHGDKIYSQCSDHEKENIDKVLEMLAKRILRLEQQNSNLKEKEEKQYRNFMWY